MVYSSLKAIAQFFIKIIQLFQQFNICVKYFLLKITFESECFLTSRLRWMLIWYFYFYLSKYVALVSVLLLTKDWVLLPPQSKCETIWQGRHNLVPSKLNQLCCGDGNFHHEMHNTSTAIDYCYKVLIWRWFICRYSLFLESHYLL